jgi:protein-arginine kinase activator protein McsA
MPRGKKTVYSGSCSECGARTATVRILKAKKGDFRKLSKFCGSCRKKTDVKIREEKHSS